VPQPTIIHAVIFRIILLIFCALSASRGRIFPYLINSRKYNTEQNYVNRKQELIKQILSVKFLFFLSVNKLSDFCLMQVIIQWLLMAFNFTFSEPVVTLDAGRFPPKQVPFRQVAIYNQTY
jgi:hypothetical protein